MAIACMLTTAASLYQCSAASHLRLKANAHDRRCRYVNNALRTVQLELRNPALHTEASARIGRDPGLTFDEIDECVLYEQDEVSYVALAACFDRPNDIACADVELTRLRTAIQQIEQR
jgi:hypothetical protein